MAEALAALFGFLFIVGGFAILFEMPRRMIRRRTHQVDNAKAHWHAADHVWMAEVDHARRIAQLKAAYEATQGISSLLIPDPTSLREMVDKARRRELIAALTDRRVGY